MSAARLQTWVVSMGLICGVILSAVPSLTQLPQAVRDEVKCSIPTIDFLFRYGRPPLFNYSSAYMAPVQEVVGSIPFRLAGRNINALRAIGVVFIAAGSIVWYFLLSRIYTSRVAVAAVASYAVCTIPIAITRVTTPGYPFGCLVVPLFLLIAYHLELRRPILLGFLGGITFYCFPIVMPYVVVIGAMAVVGEAAKTNLKNVRREMLRDWHLYTLLAGIALLLPALYFHLSRGSAALPSKLKVLSVIGALSVFFATVLLGIAHRQNPPLRRAAVTALSYAAGFLAVYLAVGFVFEHYERPYFASLGVKMWGANRYQLKNIYDWPYQVSALVGRILPLALIPAEAGAEIRVYQGRVLLFTLSGFIVAGIIGIAIWRWFAYCMTDTRTVLAKMWHSAIPISCLVIVCVLVPSWRLFGDPSLRYLIPVMPGLFVLLASALDSFAKRSPVYWTVVISYISLNILSYARSDVTVFMR